MVSENVMLNVMREVCNYFIRHDSVQRYEGEVTISNMQLSINVPSPYVIICGSNKNDGLYLVLEDNTLQEVMFDDGTMHPVDETFTGRVWFSYPPQDFIMLCHRIASFEAKTPQSDVVSESFGSSSRSFATGSNGRLTWKETYGDSLRPYRKRMFEEVW